MNQRMLMDEEWIQRKVEELARQLSDIVGGGDMVLVGIVGGGTALARALAEELARLRGSPPPVGEMDITLYRDDTAQAAVKRVRSTRIPAPVEGATVVLVDDVLHTGRSVRAAMEELMDFGRPARVVLVTLVDRGGRQLPIQPTLTGARVEVEPHESVEVRLSGEPRGVFAVAGGQQG